jgi:hypothetical protein
LQDADSGVGLLVGADLGVGQAGVVVDDGVHECGADQRARVLAALTGPVCGRNAVDLALLAAEELVAATVGDVAEPGDVDVDQRPGVRVLVAAEWFTGHAVDVGQAVDPHRTSTACTVEACIPSRPAIWTGPSRCRQRSRTSWRTTAGLVLVGLECGRELRSAIPAAPSQR